MPPGRVSDGLPRRTSQNYSLWMCLSQRQQVICLLDVLYKFISSADIVAFVAKFISSADIVAFVAKFISSADIVAFVAKFISNADIVAFVAKFISGAGCVCMVLCWTDCSFHQHPFVRLSFVRVHTCQGHLQDVCSNIHAPHVEVC